MPIDMLTIDLRDVPTHQLVELVEALTGIIEIGKQCEENTEALSAVRSQIKANCEIIRDIKFD